MKKPNYIYICISILMIFIFAYFLSLYMPRLFPQPHIVLLNIFKNYKMLLNHVYFSLQRLIISVFISIIISIPIGILIGYYNKISKIFSPLLYIFYPVPKLALLPMIMLLFGLGDLAKAIIMVSIITFPMIIQIRDSVQNMDRSTFEPYLTIGISSSTIISKIILKGILPAVLSSTRIGIGTALSVLFFAENFGTEKGIGYYIMDSWMRISYVDMYSGIISISLLGIFLFVLIDIIEKKVCTWNVK